MKALSLTQPWATLVAIGAKRIETRSWATRYRGPLAIHASKGWSKEDSALIDIEPFRAALYPNWIGRPSHMPRGFIIATARLVHVEPTWFGGYSSTRMPAPESAEFAFGDYSRGRFMWLLEDIVALADPIPARGALGLWEWTPPLIHPLRQALDRDLDP
jgi:hypothetical protein